MFPLFSMKSYQLVVIDTEEKTVEFFDPMNPDKTTEQITELIKPYTAFIYNYLAHQVEKQR